MKGKLWRNLAEIIGVFGIMAGLLMVALELRQANEIARTQVIMNLAAQYNEFNSARFQDPAVAELSLKLIQPDRFDLSETDASMMAGAAWHFANILWSAQTAHDSGLLSDADLALYRSHLEWMLLHMPGLAVEFEAMARSNPGIEQAPVFQPLKALTEARAGE